MTFDPKTASAIESNVNWSYKYNRPEFSFPGPIVTISKEGQYTYPNDYSGLFWVLDKWQSIYGNPRPNMDKNLGFLFFLTSVFSSNQRYSWQSTQVHYFYLKSLIVQETRYHEYIARLAQGFVLLLGEHKIVTRSPVTWRHYSISATVNITHLDQPSIARLRKTHSSPLQC